MTMTRRKTTIIELPLCLCTLQNGVGLEGGGGMKQTLHAPWQWMEVHGQFDAQAPEKPRYHRTGYKGVLCEVAVPVTEILVRTVHDSDVLAINIYTMKTTITNAVILVLQL
jgi:hypothetical protein